MLWLLGSLSAAIYGANFRIGELLVRLGVIDAAPDAIISYLIQVISLGLIYCSALRVTTRMEEKNGSYLAPILLFAFLFRLPLIPLDPALSSDIYRYVWEGKVQVVAGMNPYVFPPANDRLALLRDQEIYPHINRKESPTIYPPGAQLLFASAHWTGFDTPQELKALALAADALTFLLLLLILRQLRLPLSRVIIYAWNPLVIYELFYSGHLESFLLPLLLLFIYLFLRGCVLAAGIALGAATAIKLVPLFLLATLPRGSRFKMFVPFVAVIALTYLFYLEAGTQVLGFLQAILLIHTRSSIMVSSN
jgi:alpha-1,6-mannosyltransferase